MMFDFFKKKPKKPSMSKTPPRPEPKQSIPLRPIAKPRNSPPEQKANVPSKPKPSFRRQEPGKEFLRVFKQLTYRHRSLEIWNDFTFMFACALSNPVDKSHYDEREANYLKTIKKYSREEQLLFPKLAAETVMALELEPEQDFLGKIYMTLDLGNGSMGQIFTPYHVCQLMAEIVVDNVVQEVKENGYITINDPCCGAGATLIAGIHAARKALEKEELNFQNHVLIVAQEIDVTVALMCYIQISLLGVAGYVKIGNSLTEPMVSGDSLENYWFTPMYFSDIWSTRRLIKKMDYLRDENDRGRYQK